MKIESLISRILGVRAVRYGRFVAVDDGQYGYMVRAGDARAALRRSGADYSRFCGECGYVHMNQRRAALWRARGVKINVC